MSLPHWKSSETRWEQKPLYISDLASTTESLLATSDDIWSSQAVGKATEPPPQEPAGEEMPTDFKDSFTM